MSVAEFRALHRRGQPLVLVNVWDAATASMVEAAGFPAVATSSLAVAGAAGYEDGQALPFEALLAAATRIKAAISKPLSVDCEAGYADDADGVRETIAALVKLGVAGINLEDGLAAGKRELVDIAIARAKIAAAREQASSNGCDLHINARIDTFILAGPGGEPPIDETLRRAHAYAEAGANSIFVPFLADLAIIERLAREIPLPLNILMLAKSPSVAELASAGVGRISLGSFPYRWFERTFKRAVATFARDGSPAIFAGDA